MSVDTTARELMEALQPKKGTTAYDTQATVTRVDGDTLWVHIPGGVDETPIQRTIAASEGDVVQVRVSGGSAFAIGNASAPPTDDREAFVAQGQAGKAQKTADEALEYLKIQRADIEELNADVANVGTLVSTAQSTADGAASAASAAQSTANGANNQEQRIYYRKTASGAPTAPTAWVTATGDAYGSWTTKVPPLTSGSTKYPYLYTCIQRKTVAGAVSCSTVLLDDSTTVIDGGNIITGTVTTNQLAANSVTTAKLAANSVTADQLASNSVTTAKLAANSVTAAKINVTDLMAQDMTATGSFQVNNSKWLMTQDADGVTFQTKQTGTRFDGTAQPLSKFRFDSSGLTLTVLAPSGYQTELGLFRGNTGNSPYFSITDYNTAKNMYLRLNESQFHVDAESHYFSGDATWDGGISPGENNEYTLGSSSYRWSDIYANGGNFGGAVIPSATGTHNLGSSSNLWNILYARFGQFSGWVHADSGTFSSDLVANNPHLYFNIGTNDGDPSSTNPHVEFRRGGNSTSGYSLNLVYYNSAGTATFHTLVNGSGAKQWVPPLSTKTVTGTTNNGGNIGLAISSASNVVVSVHRTDAASMCTPFVSTDSGNWSCHITSATASAPAVTSTSVTLFVVYYPLPLTAN